MKIAKPGNIQEVTESLVVQGQRIYLGQLGSGHPDRDNTLELLLRYPPELRGKVLLWRCAATHWFACSRKAVESITIGLEWVEDFYGWQQVLTQYSESPVSENFVVKEKTNCFLSPSPRDIPCFDSMPDNDADTAISPRLFDSIFMRIPANAEQCVQEILELMQHLHPEGRLLLCGLNSEGAKSLPGRLKKLGLKLMLRAQAASSRLFELSARPEQEVAEPVKQKIHWQVQGQEQPLLHTIPGVFSRRKLDAGTELLLHSLPDLKYKKVLDLGCGAGFLAVYAALQGAVVTASDHSALAIALCEYNARACGVKMDTICSYMGVGLHESFDVILTNPPFHQGKVTDMGVGRIWLKQCRGLLKPGGECLAVVNRFLNYQDFGEELGLDMRMVSETSAFRVWSFHLPKV